LLRPFRVTRPIFRADSVLELPAHAIITSRTEIGDQLVIERYEARKTVLTDSTDTAGTPQGSENDLLIPAMRALPSAE
jgi:hypothetical protein